MENIILIADLCMMNDVFTCRKYCQTQDADLVINYSICIHQYFCDCNPCPEFYTENCEIKCNDTGRISYMTTDHMGCKICDCQCPFVNFTLLCAGFSHKVLYNQNGCPECTCTCPVIDCDLECEGERLGIIGPTDRGGGCSSTCLGCISN